MKITMISLHFSEYAARLAISLSVENNIQLHLSKANADMELTVDLRAELEGLVEVHFHPRTTRLNSLYRALSINHKIRRFRPDIVHGQEAGDWAHAAIKILSSDVPFVYTVHDPRPHSGSDRIIAMRNRWPRKFLRRSADAVIVHGASIVKQMEEIEPSTAGNIHVVMHGVLGIPSSYLSNVGSEFLFFGRIEIYKGLGVLLEAIEILNARGDTVNLRIVGRGPDLEWHRARIASLPNVTLFEGFVPAVQVPEIIRRSRAVILPYRDATQSGVIANAFGARVPVVASRVGAFVDILEDGVNALVVPPDNPHHLADAISQLQHSDELCKILGWGASKTALSLLSWSEISKTTLKIYQGVKYNQR